MSAPKDFSAVEMSAQFVNYLHPEYAVSAGRLLPGPELQYDAQFVSE